MRALLAFALCCGLTVMPGYGRILHKASQSKKKAKKTGERARTVQPEAPVDANTVSRPLILTLYATTRRSFVSLSGRTSANQRFDGSR